MYKIIVAHPHQQHSYQLAAGLKKAGMLKKYITTVYYKKHSLTSLLINALKGEIKKRAIARRSVDLNDNDVMQFCELYGLLYLLLMRVTHNNKRILDPYNRFVSRRFGRKVAKYAIKNNVDAVVCFDTECKEMFEYLERYAPSVVRIMDASAINRLYLKNIYIKDMMINPEFAIRLKNERPELFSKSSKKTMYRLKKEIILTDYFLSPSKIVDESFIYSGVEKSRLLRCPYGVDLTGFKYQEKKACFKSLNVIYVGGIKELKGFGTLLKAFNRINPKVASLTVVGMGNKNDEDISPFIKNVSFTGHIIHNDINRQLEKADVFVFPSLGDSFGLAVLEGMSIGLPPVVSENSGIADYISTGENGFIIPVFDVDSIVNHIQWLYDNPTERIKMGKKASELAQRFTWDKYQKYVVDNIKDVLRERVTCIAKKKRKEISLKEFLQ